MRFDPSLVEPGLDPEESVGWSLVPPASFLLLGYLIWLLGANREAFLWLNGLSAMTGTTVWAGITLLGDSLVLLALALPLVLWRPRLVWGMVAAAVITTVLSHALKYGLDLARPAAVLAFDEITIIGPTLKWRAMPSGHAAAAMTVAGALVPVITRPAVRYSVFLLLLLAAVSRVVVGAHWPLDVLAGAALGWGCGVMGRRLLTRSRWADSRLSRCILGLLLGGSAVALLWYDSQYAEAYRFQALVALVSLGSVLLMLAVRRFGVQPASFRRSQLTAVRHPQIEGKPSRN